MSSVCCSLSSGLIISFSQRLLSSYYVPGTEVDSRNTSMNKTTLLLSYSFHSNEEKEMHVCVGGGAPGDNCYEKNKGQQLDKAS